MTAHPHETAPRTETPRRVAVDFLYLDATTCRRCVATGDALEAALAMLAPALRARNVTVNVNRVAITTPELARHHRFLASPTIRVDGADICTDVRQNHCADCSDLSGCATDCRVFVWQGREYDQPPAEAIADGILRALDGPPAAPAPEPYAMPRNLTDYFHGRTTLMKTIQVFEPALCCDTGVCGPDPAQELIAFTADLAYLKGCGASITRHNLANDPLAFAQTEPVRRFLEVAGSEGLPLTLVDGAVALTGRYPSRGELTRFAGLDAGEPATACCDTAGCDCGGSAPSPAASECECREPAPAASGCGCGSGCGC